MKYFKNIQGGYIAALSTGSGGEEITQEEYERILSLVRACPKADTGYQYRLKTDLTWELVEMPPEDTDPEISESEALDIILGGEAW